MPQVKRLSIHRAPGSPIKIEGVEVSFQLGDLYVPGGVTIRDTHVKRVRKATADGVTPTHTYGVIPASYSANTFRVGIYREPAHTEVPAQTDLSVEMSDESLNFTLHVD